MDNELAITQRELLEIKHSLYYAGECNHGTANHNLLVLLAKLATDKGFTLSLDRARVTIPIGVKVTS
jgi:hypothetical protein